MRLINADALEKTLRDWIRDHWTEAFTGDDAGAEFADMIDRAETVDANPTVHAHWVACESDEYEDEYKCSACGIQFIAIEPQEEGWKYCPCCGARMDEEEE